MPTQVQLDSIILISIPRWKDFWGLIRYLKNCKNNKELQDAILKIDKKSLQSFSWWKKIIVFLFKDFIIINELKRIRSRIFNVMFNQLNSGLNEQEIMDIVTDSGNYWLSFDHVKLTIIKDFCNNFLLTPAVFENFCRLETDDKKELIKIGESYHDKRKRLMCIFRSLINDAKKEYVHRKKIEIYLSSGGYGSIILKDDIELMLAEYKNAEGDTTFLEK